MKTFRYLWKSQDGHTQGWRTVRAKNLLDATEAAKADCPSEMRVTCVEIL